MRRRILTAVMPYSEYNEKDAHFATVWLDMSMVSEGVHGWISRRWNAFNVSMNIFLGLLIVWLSFHICFSPLSSRHTPAWWNTLGITTTIGFLINALIARNDTMKMFDFAARKLWIDK